MFEIPDQDNIRSITITAEVVRGEAGPILARRRKKKAA